MSDHIDSAAKVLADAEDRPLMSIDNARARTLASAGLLVTPAHDAEVAAKALREAAEAMHDLDDLDAIHMHNGDADLWLDARADRIEREGGESDA